MTKINVMESLPEYPMLDITDPQSVEVVVRADKKVVWINVDGICVLRACRIPDLKVTKIGSK